MDIVKQLQAVWVGSLPINTMAQHHGGGSLRQIRL
jgi:hypothetical protein